jgi:tRNA threonylcarbamoyladenosine biosynthesis protein TsaB
MLLAIDTSTRTVGVALYDGDQVWNETTWTSQDYHTVELAPGIQDILQKSGVVITDVEAIAVAIGPGSFTGLRIGLAVAKGIALARHIPILGVPTLDIVAAAAPLETGRSLAAVLRAGRGRLAVGWYQIERAGWRSIKRLEVLTAQDLADKIQEPTLVCGELTENERRLLARKRKIVHLLSPARSLRRPGYLAEIGWRRWRAGKVDDPATLTPIYLHQSDPIPG